LYPLNPITELISVSYKESHNMATTNGGESAG